MYFSPPSLPDVSSRSSVVVGGLTCVDCCFRVVLRKSSQRWAQRESLWSRPAPWQRRGSCRWKTRWGVQTVAPVLTLWRDVFFFKHLHWRLRPATASSHTASTPRWRARRSTTSWTGCTWPCPTRETRRWAVSGSSGRDLSDPTVVGWFGFHSACSPGEAAVHPGGSADSQEGHGGGHPQTQTGTSGGLGPGQ